VFKKILIANRGEIAVRIIRAAKEMGISTVVIYSDEDIWSLHTRYGDEAYPLGGKEAKESYLNIDKIIEIAKVSKAEAIHPGYGFLAENVEFANRCEQEGIKFIGPTGEAIELLGDKIGARRTMERAGIPVIPGISEGVEDLSPEEVLSFSKKIGFPILLKAAGGGGGKGMRVVYEEKELVEKIKEASMEAKSSFGTGKVYMEKYLINPHHIEFQVLADEKGKVIHLYERECSIQRRYQKLIEEAPSPFLDEKLRKRMGEVAIEVVKASNYTNAGTVEFMVEEGGKFYFLEMNTRLQVEHPVTELVTGVDIVKEQFKIAFGERLTLKNIPLNGAAIECRISAEDPEQNFIPSVGEVKEIIEPGGPGVRIESGIYPGCNVSLYYDPLISKLLTWGITRGEAIERMRRALEEYKIVGIKTTIPFHQQVMRDEKFVQGKYDTGFLKEFTYNKKIEGKVHPEVIAIATALGKELTKEEEKKEIKKEGITNLWKWGERFRYRF